MKKIIFPISLLILFTLQLYGQDEFLITLTGDTLAGKIEFIQSKYYDEVYVNSKDGKQALKIFHINQIVKGDTFYEMIAFKDRNVAAQIIKKGKLSLYLVRDDGDYDFAIRFLVKEDGERMIVSNIGFRKNMTQFLGDCPTLVTKISDGDFNSNDLEKIVTFYNERCKILTKIETAKAPELLNFINLINDLEGKMDKGIDVPDHMIKTLESYKSKDFNILIERYIESLIDKG